jgi:hypothetical protein
MCFKNIPIIYFTNEDPRILAEANPDKYAGLLARLQVITIDPVSNPADVVDWDYLAKLAKDKKKYDWDLTKQMVHLAPGEIPFLSESDSGPDEIIDKQMSKRKEPQSTSFILTEASKKLKPLSEQVCSSASLSYKKISNDLATKTGAEIGYYYYFKLIKSKFINL